MRNSSWDDLIKLIEGEKLNYQPTGFILIVPGYQDGMVFQQLITIHPMKSG